MNVSMNGLRKNLTGAFNRFVRMLKDEDWSGDSSFEKLSQEDVEALEELRQMVGALNCVYSEGDETFIDLSDLALEPVGEEDEDDDEEGVKYAGD